MKSSAGTVTRTLAGAVAAVGQAPREEDHAVELASTSMLAEISAVEVL